MTKDYEDIATSWQGEIWRPHFVVSKENDGYYWRDLAATDGWSGPFRTSRAAWKNVCETNDLL